MSMMNAIASQDREQLLEIMNRERNENATSAFQSAGARRITVRGKARELLGRIDEGQGIADSIRRNAAKRERNLLLQLRQPHLQDWQAAVLDCSEGDSHPRVDSGIDHISQSSQAHTTVRDSQSDRGTIREKSRCLHKAAEQAQVLDPPRRALLGLSVGEFNTSHE
jgi:hypothetical protein